MFFYFSTRQFSCWNRKLQEFTKWEKSPRVLKNNSSTFVVDNDEVWAEEAPEARADEDGQRHDQHHEEHKVGGLWIQKVYWQSVSIQVILDFFILVLNSFNWQLRYCDLTNCRMAFDMFIRFAPLNKLTNGSFSKFTISISVLQQNTINFYNLLYGI